MATSLRFVFMFQFTLPCRERRHSPIPITLRVSFNSRSRVGSDLFTEPRSAAAGRFQFTLPCRERHTARDTVDDLRDVSIHAPV